MFALPIGPVLALRAQAHWAMYGAGEDEWGAAPAADASSHSSDNLEDSRGAELPWQRPTDEAQPLLTEHWEPSLSPSTALPAAGGSSFGQTAFNATNTLMGVGLLSLPYTLRLSGWFGVLLLVCIAALTRYTAKLLGRIMEYVPAQKLREGPGAYAIQGLHDVSPQATFCLSAFPCGCDWNNRTRLFSWQLSEFTLLCTLLHPEPPKNHGVLIMI